MIITVEKYSIIAMQSFVVITNLYNKIKVSMLKYFPLEKLFCKNLLKYSKLKRNISFKKLQLK